MKKIKRFLLSILLILFSLSSIYSQDIDNVDSLKGELDRLMQEDPYSENSIRTLNFLAQFYMKKSPVKALSYAYEAIEISYKLKNSTEIYPVYGTIGMIYQEQGFFDKAMEFFFKSMFYFENKSDRLGYAWVYVNIGNIYFQKREFEKSRKYYEMANENFKKVYDLYGQATSTNNIGLIFKEQNNCDSSFYYFKKALDIRKKLGEKVHIALSYRYLGNSYEVCGKDEKALEYYNKALEMYRKANNDEGEGQILNFIGDFFLDRGKYDEALSRFLASEQLYRKNSDFPGLSISLNKVSQAYFKMGNYQLAIENALQSIETSKINELLLQQRESYFIIYQSFAKLSDYKNALEYSEKYFAFKDSISNENVEKKISQLEFVLSDRKFEREIKILEKDREIQALILKKKTNLVYYFIISSIVLIILVLSNLRKFNYRVKLAKQFSLGAGILSKVGVVFLVGIYFTLFMFLFQPFGLSELDFLFKVMVYAAFGIISMSVLFLNFVIFHLIEKWVKNEKWDVVKYVLFVFFMLIGISTVGYNYARFYGIDELVSISFFDVLIVVFSLTIFPVFLIIVFIEKIYLNRHEQIAKVISHHLKNVEKPFEDHLIHIKSDKSKEEVQILLSQFICAEAKGNYAEFNYINNKKLKKTLMLISMKVIEDQLKGYEKIIRCHKSYIVNTNKIEKVSGNSQGYKLTLKDLDFKIPVSRNFPKELLKELKQTD